MRMGWVLLVVLVVVGLAWLALRERDTEAPRRSQESTGAQSGETPSPAGAKPEEPAAAARATGKISGRVVRSDDSPAVGAEVTAVAESGDAQFTATAAKDGTFQLEGLHRGPYRVRARLVDSDKVFEGELGADSGAEDIRVTLAEVLTPLHVRVLTPNGDDLPNFEAGLSSAGGYYSLGPQQWGRISIDPTKVRGSGSGPLRWVGAVLEIWGARGHGDMLLQLCAVRVGPLTAQQTELTVRLKPWTMVQGVVSGPHMPQRVILSPPSHWAGWVTDDTGGMPERFKCTVVTDDVGRFQFHIPRAGVDYGLIFPDSRGLAQAGSWTVRAGDGPLVLVLHKYVEARVRVLGPDRKPVRGAFVRTVAPRDDGFRGGRCCETDAKGIAVLRRLHPRACYKLIIDPNYEASIDRTPSQWSKRRHESPPFLAEEARDGWVPEETTVVLRWGHSVRGSVRDLDGQPVAGRYVGLCTRVGFAYYETQADGRFVFHGVPPGRIYIGLDEPSSQRWNVDLLRFAMWDASFGYGPEGPRRKKSPVPAFAAIEVKGDVDDVTLRVPATLAVHLTFPSPSDVSTAQDWDKFGARTVKISHRTKEGWEYVQSASADFRANLQHEEARRLQVNGLLPGHTYAAWMSPIGGRYAYREFQAESGSLTLKREAGGVVRGRVLCQPVSGTRPMIQIWDDRERMVRRFPADPDGRFEKTGLPDSTWTVRATSLSDEHIWFFAEGKVATGGSIELRLAPELDGDK